MDEQQEKKRRKWYLLLYPYLLLILFALLTVTSYTWFSLTQTPRVSDMYMFVNGDSGLELSLTPDAEVWELQLDFRDMVDVTTVLRPITWSDADQRFYAVSYGIDGRLTGRVEALSDARNANTTTLDGYYIKASFYARSNMPVDVSLSPAVEVDDGIQGSGTYLIGYPQWDAENIVHNNGGLGGECAVRIGFRITPVDSTGEAIGESSEFYIYEPNSDIHINGTTGYIPTQSIDSTPHLVDESRLILQTASTWTEADPVQRGVVIHELGEFTTDPYLFSLDEGEMVRIDIYIWLEGQDVDCTNEINRAKILASIQFDTLDDDPSGMVPIE